jgi:hypothetical protein
MTTTHTRTTFAVAVGAAIAGAAAPALLFLGAGTAHALPELSERGAIAVIDDLPTPRTCGQCGGFNPQPDPPGNPDPGSRVGISDPEDKVGIGNPDIKTGAIGDAENLPGPHIAPGQ